MEDKAFIEKQSRVIKALEDLLILYVDKQYQITGLLSPTTNFSLEIKGPFGNGELLCLIKRLQLDVKMLGDGRINQTNTIKDCIEELKKLSAEQALPENKLD